VIIAKEFMTVTLLCDQKQIRFTKLPHNGHNSCFTCLWYHRSCFHDITN